MAELILPARFEDHECQEVSCKHSYLFTISDVQNESDTSHFMESLCNPRTVNKNFSHESSLDFNFVKDINFDQSA